MEDHAESLKGRAKGGAARAAKLTPERRSEIARHAALARHGEKPLRFTHKGSFKEHFGFDVECYVLDDDAKTAVISQRGMGMTLGLGEGGSRLPAFINGKIISAHVGQELRAKLDKPVVFQGPVAGGNLGVAALMYGYDVTVLIDVCKAIVAASGDLRKAQANILKQAQIIISASAKSGIKGLVYALAGYDQTRDEVISAFKLYVREEAREYEKEFPDLLYKEWYRLYQLPEPVRNKPWKFMHLTVEHVYSPLARSNGKILRLTRQQRDKSEERRKKLHLFLSEIGVKALRTHLGQLLGIARISKTQGEYEDHVQTLFGAQPDLFKI